MTTELPNRIDEVAASYVPARKADTACGVLFYLLVILSFVVLFPEWLGQTVIPFIKTAFLLLTLALFSLFVVSKLYLIPTAERVRRKQLLADAFGAALTPEKTVGYYNNAFPPSHQRLAANVMENAFFGKETTRLMLPSVRMKTGAYLLFWLACLGFRHSSMDLVLWISQLVFSVDIVAYWLSLEVLRARHERVYEDLYQHFLHSHGEATPIGSASVLDSFATYEASKSVAGVLMDSGIFFRENGKLSARWKDICQRLTIPTI